MKIALIGLGNILMQDEGVGVHAIKVVQEHYQVPPELDVVDGGTAGLDLLPFLEGRDRVLFVDAVDWGEAPGFIGVLKNEAIPQAFGKSKASLHHVGLAEVLATARLLDTLPQEVWLIGIQPQSLEVGLELTEVLQEKLEPLVAAIAATLGDWGVPLVRRAPAPSSS